MEIRCRCPACRAKLDVAAKHAGKTIHCPRCSGDVVVPPLNDPAWHEPSTPAATDFSPAIPPPVSESPQPPPSVLPPPLPTTPDPDREPFAGLDLHLSTVRSTAGPAAPARVAARRNSNSIWPLVLAGGALLLAGGILLGMYLAQGSSPGVEGARPARRGGTLVLAWPEGDRADASLTIDGRHSGFASQGELRYELPAGIHTVSIARPGYRPFTRQLVLRGDAAELITPEWQPLPGAQAAALGEPADIAPAAAPSNAHHPIRGFPNWLSNYSAARQQAAAEQRELVLVFGCSDAQPSTQELAQALQTPSGQNAIGPRVRVMIDLPRVPADRELARENRRLMSEFGITRLPALALADEAGRIYALEKRWEGGLARLDERLSTLAKQRIDRDRLLAAAGQGSEADQLGAASVSVKWLSEHELCPFYRAEIRGWAELAQRLDPGNEQRLLEAFFEPQWTQRVQEINPRDAAEVQHALAELQLWSDRKFGDADRGARVHLLAVTLLSDAGRLEEATRQMEQAVQYQPRDGRLAESLRQVQQHLDNRDVLSSGSGFLVTSAGHVLTNQHVVAGAGKIVIRVPNSKDTLAAEVIGQDAERDLALLKIELPTAGLLQPLALRLGDMRRGSAVALFGYPLGDALGANLKFTSGTISALPEESNHHMYLLDATVNPGSSGGPVCDARGNVIGLVSAKTGGRALEDSYGLAIPAAAIAKFLDQHLPVAASRPVADTNEAALDWGLVDERVSGGVLMVVSKAPPAGLRSRPAR